MKMRNTLLAATAVAIVMAGANGSAATIDITGGGELTSFDSSSQTGQINYIIDFTLSGISSGTSVTVNAPGYFLGSANFAISMLSGFNGYSAHYNIYNSSNGPLQNNIDTTFTEVFSGLRNGQYILSTNVNYPLVAFESGVGTHVDAPSIISTQVSSVPLPAALPMFGAALFGLGGLGMRKRKAAQAA